MPAGQSLGTFIDNATTYANMVLADARGALGNAEQTIRSIGHQKIWTGLPDLSATLPDVPVIDFDLPLNYGAIDTTLEAPPDFQGTLVAIGDVNPGAEPVLSAVVPSLSMPARPADMAGFTGTMPAIQTDVLFPEPPAALDASIVPPTLVDRAAPQQPVVTLPSFTALAPVPHGAAPTGLDQEFDQAWRTAVPQMVQMLDDQVDAMLRRYNPRYHAQMAAIEDKLERLMQGGSGLSPAVEDAIYERARDKTHAEYRRAQDGAWKDAAARGFTLPPGALHAALLTSRLALAEANARAVQDIAIKQAEMEQQNLQFAITTSAGLRTTLLNAAMGYHQSLASINGQAIDYAKTIASMVVEAYNLQLKDFELRLEVYRAEASIYETRLKGAMAAIDLYRAEIDALQAMTQVDMAKVNAYKAQVETLGVLANVYRTRVEAVQSRAALEKLKLEMFQAQVQTYATQVQAKNAEWQGYQSAISGEEAKVRIFSEQVQAYTAQMNGFKTRVEAQAEGIRAKAAANQAILDRFSAELKAYTAKVEARAEISKIISADAQMRLSAHQSGVDARLKHATMALEIGKVRYDSFYKNAEYRLRADIASAEGALGYQRTLADLASNVANAYTGIAKASLSGMTTIVGMTEETTGPLLGGG